MIPRIAVGARAAGPIEPASRLESPASRARNACSGCSPLSESDDHATVMENSEVGGWRAAGGHRRVGACTVSVSWNRSWNVPMPDVKASSDPAVIARGEYLATGPAHCVECHMDECRGIPALPGEGRTAVDGRRLPVSARARSAHSTPGTSRRIGRPASAASPTSRSPACCATAVRPDGQRVDSPADAVRRHERRRRRQAIVSYLRTQPPVRNVVPENEWTLMGKVDARRSSRRSSRSSTSTRREDRATARRLRVGSRASTSRAVGRQLRRLPLAAQSADRRAGRPPSSPAASR